jgi:hypothetical protein
MARRWQATGPRASPDHRPAPPTRTCCKTALKFLSSILRRSLLKRVGGLAVDNQHPVREEASVWNDLKALI